MRQMVDLGLFQEGVTLILSQWVALNAGIVNGMTTPNFIPYLVSQIFSFFDQQPNAKETISFGALGDLLIDELDCVGIDAEDGSIPQVANNLMSMHKECLEGNYQSIQKLRGLPPIAVQVINSSDDEEDDDEDVEESHMMVDSQGPLPNTKTTLLQNNESIPQEMGMIDEEGWETVSCRKNKGRKTRKSFMQ